jgi:hypothetical protein
MSPPSPPAGPIPIPYPNTSQTSDTSDGSKTVKIGGAEVGKKNASNYKKSTGDEAATKSFGMNLTSHTIQGKMKHAAWSMDVKIEGANAIRHMDLTTHNHMNTSGTNSMTADQELEAQAEAEAECKELDKRNQEEVAKIKEKQKKKEEGQAKWANDKAERDKKAGKPPAAPKEKDAGGWAVTSALIVNPNNPNYSGYWNATSRNEFVPKNSSSSYQKPHPTSGSPTPDCAEIKYQKNIKGSPPGSKAKKKLKPREAGTPKVWTERCKDSEARLLNPLMTSPNRAGMKITMKVYHEFHASPGQGDSLPCYSCREAICGAVKCDIEVWLCKNDNTAVNAQKMCEDGEPKPKGAPDGPGADGPPPVPGSKAEFWAKSGFGPR